MATGTCDMNSPLGADSQSWVLTSESVVSHQGHREYETIGDGKAVQEGDIIVSSEQNRKTAKNDGI